MREYFSSIMFFYASSKKKLDYSLFPSIIAPILSAKKSFKAHLRTHFLITDKRRMMQKNTSTHYQCI